MQNHIKEMREKTGYTANELSRLLGMTYFNYQKIENDEITLIRKDTIDHLCEYLSCNIEDLFTAEPKPKAAPIPHPKS